jgi:3',5'-cyclic AMP phosphodiesterase CpdA
MEANELQAGRWPRSTLGHCEPPPRMIRLAHLSDLHLTTSPLGWQWRDWFSKRTTGWLNLRWLGRAHRFRQADQVLAALVADLYRLHPARVIFSGDATTLGFESELVRAAQFLRLGQPDALPGLAVPGNHDYYLRSVARAGLFERYFAAWQSGERIDSSVYPFAQRVGPLWLVAVNSSTGNFWTWDASGQVDAAQLERLRRLLDRLEGGPRILVTHYPVCLASGRRERRTHGLRNVAQVVDIAARGGIGLWLHGHRHDAYHLMEPSLAPFPIACAGSGTQCGRWSYGDYQVEDCQLRGTRRTFSEKSGRFETGEQFEVTIRVA